MTRNRGNSKTHHLRSTSLRIFDARQLGDFLVPEASKMEWGKKHVTREIRLCAKRPLASRNHFPFLGQNVRQVYLVQELFSSRTLSRPPVSPGSTYPGPSLPTLYLMWRTAGKGNYAPTPTQALTHSSLPPSFTVHGHHNDRTLSSP